MEIRKRGNIQKAKNNLSNFLDHHHREIIEHWKNTIQDRYGRRELNQEPAAIAKYKNDDRDILSYLIGILSGNKEDENLYLASMFQRLRMGDFSIADFYSEILCLEESIVSFLGNSKEYRPEHIMTDAARIRKVLSGLFETLLKGTSEVYEYVIESGGRGFCHLDEKGRIIYANDEMKRILNDTAPNRYRC